ncbi:hypothetical protein C7999DRAFT_27860 [Corynascus novoguineensis]|uniref:Uncharacterized protein n=1 Tax=Corynascus novoguineensis TaxID=1126955 RepID=A0AAN7CZY0_9PEZI|nr:hypothetical protein C7999DRAFT_27860 [Corynascus novoguineensis]
MKPTNLAGLIQWLPPLEQLPDHSRIRSKCYNHPVVILSPRESCKGEVVVLILTSFGGKDIADSETNERLRRAYLPIHPTRRHAEAVALLHLKKRRELRKKSYANTRQQHTIPFSILRPYTWENPSTRYALTADSYRVLIDHAKFVLVSPAGPLSTPPSTNVNRPAGGDTAATARTSTTISTTTTTTTRTTTVACPLLSATTQTGTSSSSSRSSSRAQPTPSYGTISPSSPGPSFQSRVTAPPGCSYGATHGHRLHAPATNSLHHDTLSPFAVPSSSGYHNPLSQPARQHDAASASVLGPLLPLHHNTYASNNISQARPRAARENAATGNGGGSSGFTLSRIWRWITCLVALAALAGVLCVSGSWWWPASGRTALFKMLLRRGGNGGSAFR